MVKIKRADRVLRRRGGAAFGLLVIVGALVGVVVGLVKTITSTTMADQWQFIAATLPVIWLVWLVGPHPRIILYDDTLVAVNWFVRYEIPWAVVDSIDAKG
ncbi:hypothetical protein [Labedaea rhizosphaerae]|uniref:hypothetical protein n=1 Tax=Labedaea rhizosphaerae TaxID=598644 RepID=UPI00105FF62F|nr:hypothetical protein [Labedaea rhizosphaerae]